MSRRAGEPQSWRAAEPASRRAGEPQSRQAASGYGRQVLKKKLCRVGDGDKPDGFGPSACQTYRGGLQGKLKDLLRDETGAVHTRSAQSGTIPAGYGPTDFNKWDVFYAMAVTRCSK